MSYVQVGVEVGVEFGVEVGVEVGILPRLSPYGMNISLTLDCSTRIC